MRLMHVPTPTQCTSLYESLLHVLQTYSTQICSFQETVLWQCLKYKGCFRREGVASVKREEQAQI